LAVESHTSLTKSDLVLVGKPRELTRRRRIRVVPTDSSTGRVVKKSLSATVRRRVPVFEKCEFGPEPRVRIFNAILAFRRQIKTLVAVSTTMTGGTQPVSLAHKNIYRITGTITGNQKRQNSSAMQFIHAFLLLAGAFLFGPIVDVCGKEIPAVFERNWSIDAGANSFRTDHHAMRKLGPTDANVRCSTEWQRVSSCLEVYDSDSTCYDCVWAAYNTFFAAGKASCNTFEAAMCEAFHFQCDCSPCADEFQSFFFDCLHRQECPGMVCTCCSDPCKILLDEATACLTFLAPLTCLGCLNEAFGAQPSDLACESFAQDVCDTTWKDCLCTPCEERVQNYLFCTRRADCPNLECTDGCADQLVEAQACEVERNSKSNCVVCARSQYGTIAVAEQCGEVESELCQVMYDRCQCQPSCINIVAGAVSCGSRCEGLHCNSI